MYRGRRFPLVLLVAINCLFNSPANAGVVKRSIRMVREVYPPDTEPESEGNQPQVCIVGDVVYGADESVPAEQPCLKCRCKPPGVQCETVQCAKKPGCKAIHRSNKCCPDYQCECEHNGKIYGNGEKLATNPGGECKVCYCRGGEVQCAEVSCYIRKDCEGRRVPGTCCPKYDHCPPIDALPDRTFLTTETPLNTLKPVILGLWPENSNSTDVSSVPTLNNTPEDSNKVPDTSDSVTVPLSFQEIPKKEEGMLPRITIQEIIPERKEIPITAPPKIFISEPQGTLLIEESLPTIENASNDLNIDTEPDSSEISEVFQHPPPVLRIGDKLLFLKKGELIPEKDASTPHSVITIIGAEGLQRGGVEESLEVHEVKISPEIEVTENKSGDSDNDVGTGSKTNGSETKDVNGAATTKPDGSVEAEFVPKADEDQKNVSETNDLELRAAESTHILSLVKKKNKNEAATTSTTTQEPTTVKEEALTTLISSIEEPRTSEATKTVTESAASSETTAASTAREAKESVSTSDASTTPIPKPEPTTEAQTKNTEPIVEQNPAYPPLPDAMPAAGDVSQKFEIELENDNATTMEIKILPEVFDFLSNKTKNQTALSHSEWLKSETSQKNNESLVNFKAAMLPDELLNQKSAIDEDEDAITEFEEPVSTSGYEIANVTEIETEISSVKPSVPQEVTGNDSNLGKSIDQLLEQPDSAKSEQTAEEVPEIKAKKVKKDRFEEEGAQLIAEVKLSDDLSQYSQTTLPFTIPPELGKILEEDNKTSVKNNEPSKKTDTIELKVLNEQPNTTISQVEYIKNMDKSVESLETDSADSGEQTTPKTNHSAIISTENASVETMRKEGSSETNDMVKSVVKEGSIELGSVELAETSTKSVLADVEMITTTKSIDVISNQTSPDIVAKQDVELINALNVPKPTKMDKVESSTYELLPTPEEAKSKSLIKREIDPENPHEDVFKELERELNGDHATSHKSPEEERSEAAEIFEELLEETKGNHIDEKPRTKDQEKVDNISNALAGVVLKGKAPDANILRLFGGLFRGEK